MQDLSASNHVTYYDETTSIIWFYTFALFYATVDYNQSNVVVRNTTAVLLSRPNLSRPRPRPRSQLSRPRPRPADLASRPLETKTMDSRTTTLHYCHLYTWQNQSRDSHSVHGGIVPCRWSTACRWWAETSSACEDRTHSRTPSLVDTQTHVE